MTMNVNGNQQAYKTERKSVPYTSQPTYYVANMPTNRYARQPQQDVYTPVQQRRKQNNGPKLPKISLTAALGVAASAVVCLFFGKQMVAQAKMEKAEREMAEVLYKNAQKAANKAGEASDAVSKKASAMAGDVKTAIMNCSDPILQRAAANEYSKGPMMSTKKINQILSLADLKEAKPEEIDLKRAIKIMDEKIVGMDEVKEELLDFFVQQNYNIRHGIVNKKPLVLCVNGPAGTGKTTITEVAAEAMGMHYEKISLAGANGKSVIKGTESVYTGADIGGVANGQIKGGTKRVLYCLDEAEKSASSDYNGKVEDTLLSLFDDQALFTDDNLGVPIDISQSIFFLTTNEFDKLSEPLQNRLRRIDIAPYGVDIKSKIAKLKLDGCLKKNKLDESVVKVSPESYKTLAQMTTDDGGRETTRNVDTLIKKIIAKIELGETDGKVIDVTPEFVKRELGPVSEKTSIKDRIIKAFSKTAENVAQTTETAPKA